MQMLLEPVTGPTVWRGADIKQSEWLIRWDEEHLSELERSLARVELLEKEQIRPEDFWLPSTRDLLNEVRETITNRCGFVLLRGLPVHSRFTESEAINIYRAIGLSLGVPVSQNSRGEVLGHLRDLGEPGAFERRYATNAAQAFHTDDTDLVGLLCLRPARSGGASLVASSMEAYNCVLGEHAEYVSILYKPFPKDLMNEQLPGQPAWTRRPLFCFVDGYLSGGTSTSRFVSAMRHADVPRLTAEEMSCLIFVDSLPNRPGASLSMMLEPGDIQLLNNFVVVHGRTAFEDDPFDPAYQRHLVRMWLSHFEGGRPVCEEFAHGRIGVRANATSSNSLV
jgi:hypothetical protein